MSTAILKPPDLLKCSDKDFDNGIQHLGLKELLETISLMQREQKKEQENFDSLKGELDSLSKSSSQYKQIQKEMKVSQTRMTALMNRSMKCFQQQGSQHISKSVENEDKRNSGEVEKQTKPQTTVINTVQNVKLPSENGISKAGNQTKPSNQTTATKSVSVTKVERTQQNGSVPHEVEKDFKTSKVTVTFPPKKPGGVNGESDQKPVTNGGEKSSVVKNNHASIESELPSPSFKSSVSVKPPSSQRNPEVDSQKGAESCVSNSSKSAEPAVIKAADPKLMKSTAPTVVYHMGRPMAVDQNLGKNRDQVLADIRNFKRKSEPVKPVEKDVKQIFSSAPSNGSESSKDKAFPSTSEEEEEEEVDSGSGSVEGSPKVEKFVSSFSFTQKTQNAPVSVEKPTEQMMGQGKTTPPVLRQTGKV